MRNFRVSFFPLFLLVCSLTTRGAAPVASKLPPLSIDPQRIAVIGLSSGGSMATQMSVIYPRMFSGVGVFAGTPYGCAAVTRFGSYLCLRHANFIGSTKLLQFARKQERRGLVGPLSAIEHQRIFIFQGIQDPVVSLSAAKTLVRFYSALTDPQAVEYVSNIHAGHGIPTDSFGHACSMTASPWINNCGYDGAGAALRKFWGPLRERVQADPSHGEKFSQKPYASREAKLGSTGYIYIPPRCRNRDARCPLLVALHGCLQSPDEVGTHFWLHSGYNEYAEANHFVVLYPSVKKSKGNPNSCWDWWGYTGKNFANALGPQPRAIRTMISALLEGGNLKVQGDSI